MILRRVIAHFRKQEWTAIAIDFLIVVLGVFVGLQVNNWNAARGDRAQEALYLGYLADDLQNDIDEIDYVISLAEWRMSALAAVITQATGEPMPTVRATPRGGAPIRTVPAYEEGATGIAELIRQLAADPDMMDALRYWADTQRMAVELAGIDLGRARSLIDRVDDQL